MTDKELRKLSRAKLLEMLIAQSTELETYKEKLSAAEAALKNREIIIDQAGSIAEASLALSGVFDAAQSACREYTENIRLLSERQEKICEQMEAESRAKAAKMIADAEQRRDDLDHEARIRSAEIIRKAKYESEKYWERLSSKLEAFYDSHAGLQEMLSAMETGENMSCPHSISQGQW
ncbi:MAG: hypothetical protein GX929_02715 [Clostridiales bacterium]|jgi:hypothetical protein|nr:hypothetical protein [Clostridiales bacterium]